MHGSAHTALSALAATTACSYCSITTTSDHNLLIELKHLGVEAMKHVRVERMYEQRACTSTAQPQPPHLPLRPRARTHTLYIYIYIYINVCIYFYIHTIDIYIHIHTYTYIYIYTDRQTYDIYISSGRRAYGGRRPSVARHMLLASPAKRRRAYAASRRPAYAVRGYSVRSSICC
jgi:hypothetical protein